MKKNTILTLMLLVSTFAFAVYGELLPANFEGSPSQLEVKKVYTTCHYINSAPGDTVYYRFGAYAKNIGDTDYNNDIALRVSSLSGTSAKWTKHISVPANDSVYFKIDFPVRKGERLELAVLDVNDADISKLMKIEIPAEGFVAPQYDKFVLTTIFSRDEDDGIHTYGGDSVVCGDLILGYVLSGGKPSNMYIWPQRSTFEMRYNDVYGLDTLQVKFEEIEEVLEDFQDTENGGVIRHEVKTMHRGGCYELVANINGFGLFSHRNITLYDKPTLRFDANCVVTTGDNLLFEAQYNTGYPYTDGLVGKTYNSKIDVTYLKPVDGNVPDTLRNFLTEQHTTKFDVETYPLLAGVDTFKFQMTKPDLGEYLVNFSSDYRNGERNRTMAYSVEDTLRSEFAFPKNSFVHGSDTLATFHYKLDKKWPYILNLMKDSIPSVHIVASCIRHLNDMTAADSIKCDSLWALQTHADSIAAQAIVDSLVRDADVIGDSILIPIGNNMPLNVEGDFTFSVNNCELDDSLFINIYIKNIDTEVLSLKYPIYVSSLTDGIADLNPAERHHEAMDQRKYNLQGMPVTDDYQGIVISRGKAYLKK